ncbi:MAG: PIN domain-containing protein [Planctomycetia bacterium]|nr:PIN domain-containing protein [Planctomycetia bacterium]
MTKIPLRLYLETSFWRRLVDNQSPERRKASYRLYRFLLDRHEMLVSPLVFEELEHTTTAAELRPLLRKMKRGRVERLAQTAAVTQAAQSLLDEAGWGGGQGTDALHIAFAMMANVDVLVTWDAADIARKKTRDLVRRIARTWRIPFPELLTPVETLQWLHLSTR